MSSAINDVPPLPNVTTPLRGEDPRQVGRYRLVARLGAGGMGQVFLGFHEKHDASSTITAQQGQHAGNLAHLSRDPRIRAWQWRAIVATIAGTFFGYLLDDWRWGLTLAVLVSIVDTFVRSLGRRRVRRRRGPSWRSR